MCEGRLINSVVHQNSETFFLNDNKREKYTKMILLSLLFHTKNVNKVTKTQGVTEC